LKKYQITFYFAEEGPGHGSDQTSRKNVTSTVLIFPYFLLGFHNEGVA
jgi:hypothetical protein